MKLAVSGYYGFGNTGDEAILEALREGFKSHEIRVLGRNRRFDLASIAWCDVLISGGGGLFQDKTSTRSLLYYAGIIWSAKAMGKKVYVLGQSIGPVSNPVNRALLKRTLALADLITVRDKSSLDLLLSMKLRHKKIVDTADPALILVPQRSAVKDIKGQGPLVGICPRRFKGMSGKLTEDLAYLCDRMVSDLKARIIFIPFQNSEDRSYCAEVMSKMRHKEKLWNGKGDPLEILSIISQADLVIGTRLHSLIFAVNSQVPALGISYDPKVTSFMEEAFLPVFDAFDYDREEMLEDIRELLDNSAGVKHSLEEVSRVMRSKARMNFVLLKVMNK